MAYDTRLARLLHVLIHMYLRGGTTTSENLAKMLHTNAVVVRRIMAALHDACLVTSKGGRNGGWSLTRDLSATTAKDVYDAIPHGAVFTIAPADDNPQCPVESLVNRFIVQAMHDSEQVLLARLEGHTLSELAQMISLLPGDLSHK
ncbi:RrF2 family transcriptional regulator [Serratia sp. PAMC26656]|jgi:DNA-binding IscR family transcriptional regulator|uniref:RrF2 family transcriptional regulator n=1 Tax=Serratia sp. PAMC26656 TaxID=2775909 RepID=UPI003CE6C210